MTAVADIATIPVRAISPLEAAQAGDHDAFGDLVERHEAMVFSIALHVTNDRTAAEELAQEVFLQLYRTLASIESDSHLVFWLRQVTTRRAIDHIRRSRFRLISLDSILDLAKHEEPKDPWLGEKMLQQIAALPEMQRAVVTLRYQEDLDPSEIAAILQIPVNTVKSHLHRAIGALRKRLETSS